MNPHINFDLSSHTLYVSVFVVRIP